MLWPGISAFSRAVKKLGGTTWKTNKELQDTWLQHFERGCADLHRFDANELVSASGTDADEINRFLAERGFPDVKLTPWGKTERQFGFAAVQQLRLEWLQSGSRSTIERELRDFKAIHLKEGAFPRFWKARSFEAPVVEIPLKGDRDAVLITEHSGARGFELLNLGALLSKEIRSHQAQPLNYNEVVMPEVELTRRPNMAWMNGMEIITARGPWEVVQAIQEDRFSMNLKGVKAESAFAGAAQLRVSIQLPKPVLEITNPFIAVVVRRDVSLPLAVSWLNTDSWVRS
jgi:hypothetical protein